MEEEILYTIGKNIYSRLDDPIDKFLVCFIWEAGNRKQWAAEALGLSETTIYKRIEKIKKRLTPLVKLKKESNIES